METNASVDTILKKDSSSVYNRNYVKYLGVHLFEDSLDLRIRPLGLVEGKRKKRIKHPQANFWVKGDTDSTMHIHVSEPGFVKHGHDHHIRDKPKKQRRFSVRCVQNVVN